MSRSEYQTRFTFISISPGSFHWLVGEFLAVFRRCLLAFLTQIFLNVPALLQFFVLLCQVELLFHSWGRNAKRHLFLGSIIHIRNVCTTLVRIDFEQYGGITIKENVFVRVKIARFKTWVILAYIETDRVEKIGDVMWRGRLRWYGHVERKDDAD